MKLVDYFSAYLENTVNLNPARMDLLDTRTTAITNFLKQDEVFGPLLKMMIPQGSFAQKTIIRPRAEGKFDADLLVHLEPTSNWDACEYVGKLYTALGRSAVYADMRHRRTRCVYIDYADDFHVDLVPYVETNGHGYITNRKTDAFELTDPKGFTGWLKDQHRVTDYHLVKVIRLLKYVRDTRWGLSPKSVIFTTLIGERVSSALDPSCYADVPTTLKTVVGDLDDYLQQNYYLPVIIDPGGTNDRFDQRWDQEGYAAFRERIHSLRAKIDTAFATDGVDASVKAWRDVFDDQFKKPATTSSSSAGRGALIKVGSILRPVTERFLDKDYGIPAASTLAQIRLVGKVKEKGPMVAYRLSDNANKVDKGRDLIFEIELCSVREPYTVYWKIRNTGTEAERAGSLRGEIRKGAATHHESTLYAGSHWVECYVVKNGRCVARARQPVIIT